jgi:hypothetical protein
LRCDAGVTSVMPGLVPGIDPSASTGSPEKMNPGGTHRDDNATETS